MADIRFTDSTQFWFYQSDATSARGLDKIYSALYEVADHPVGDSLFAYRPDGGVNMAARVGAADVVLEVQPPSGRKYFYELWVKRRDSGWDDVADKIKDLIS